MLVGNSAVLRYPFPRAEFAFLERRFTPRTVFMDIGSADCTLALQAAGYVERVYALDVSGRFLQGVLVPLNLRLVLGRGVRIPVPIACYAGAVRIPWALSSLIPEKLLRVAGTK